MLNTAAYYMAVAGLAAVVLYVSWNMGSWYVNWPTYIKTEIVEQMRADFPAVTVCKMDPCQRGDGRTRNCTGFSCLPPPYDHTKFPIPAQPQVSSILSSIVFQLPKRLQKSSEVNAPDFSMPKMMASIESTSR